MGPLGVVVFDVLTDQVVHVLGPERDELVQALSLDRLHESLGAFMFGARKQTWWASSITRLIGGISGHDCRRARQRAIEAAMKRSRELSRFRALA
jgi:hypothetical protein